MKLPDELILVEDGHQVVFMRQRVRDEGQPHRSANGDKQVYCDCGEPAKLIEKVAASGKPWSAYGCQKPKDTGCKYFKFTDKLNDSDYERREAF